MWEDDIPFCCFLQWFWIMGFSFFAEQGQEGSASTKALVCNVGSPNWNRKSLHIIQGHFSFLPIISFLIIKHSILEIIIIEFGDWRQDACNRKSNQQNLGTIKSSNLCTEIVEFTSPEETAVCNLASLALPRFVREKVNIAFELVYIDAIDLLQHPWACHPKQHKLAIKLLPLTFNYEGIAIDELCCVTFNIICLVNRVCLLNLIRQSWWEAKVAKIVFLTLRSLER